MSNLTLESLSDRLTTLELQVGLDKILRREHSPEDGLNQSVIQEIANVQARVNDIYKNHNELRGLPEIICEYRGHADSFETPSGGEIPQLSAADDVTTAEKQELILLKYPVVMECYELLVEFYEMDFPSLNAGLSDQLSLEPVSLRREICEDVARKYQLLILKNLILLEEFAKAMKRKAVFAVNIEKRMRDISTKLLDIERRRQIENKY